MADSQPPAGDPGQHDWYRWSRRAYRRGSVRTGIILVVIGTFFLLANLGLLEWLRWDVAWPLALILIGIWLVARRR